jgi:hypothetical protein
MSDRDSLRAVAQVYEYMRQHRLSLSDLTDIGGEDLRSPKRRLKALHVEKCWALMARLHVRHVDLEAGGEAMRAILIDPDDLTRESSPRPASPPQPTAPCAPPSHASAAQGTGQITIPLQ